MDSGKPNQFIKKNKNMAEDRFSEFQAIINASPIIVCLWKNKPGWPLEMISENVERVFGYSAKDFTGGGINYVDVVHPDDLERISREVVDNIRHKYLDQFTQRYRIICKDGGIKWMEDRTLVRRDAKGSITHFQGIVFDITDLKQEEKRSRDLEKQLIQAQKMEAVGRLAGGVAHDFNNILAVVIGYADLLKINTALDPKGRKQVSHILEAAGRARTLTRQLLAFGRKQMLEVKVIDLNDVVSSFDKLIRRLLGEDIAVELSLSEQACPVKADISQMEQILMNLAVNARDAMPNGGVMTVETDIVQLGASYAAGKPEVTPGTYVMVGISDSGLGMDKEVQDHIFEPFFTTKSVEKGTGLGLSTVYGIVKQHHGNIYVYSEPGQGTTFKIYLPLAANDQKITAFPAEPSETTVISTATVLIAEDDEVVRDLVFSILEMQGFTVLVSKNAADAIAMARTHEGGIDLLITDVVMPDMKGPELYQQISQRQPDIKVLYMSGYTENVIFHQGVLQEGVHFIQKPFSVTALMEKVTQCMAAR